MELTEVEKQIIESYRAGADVTVTFHRHLTKDYEDAMEKAKLFGGVEKIIDFTIKGRPNFINFERVANERVEFNVFMDATRK